jgi:hypothetical protein
MTGPEHSPYDIGGSGLADSARNLVRTLQSGPTEEPARQRSLRLQIAAIAQELPERWAAEPKPIDSGRSLNYHKALWKLRDFAVELVPARTHEPSGLQVVLEAFRDRFLPDAVLILRPSGLAAITAREHMDPLRERLLELGIPSASEGDKPSQQVLAIRYPAGEQDHSLMACSVLASFHPPRADLSFAVSNGGPAVFFAAAADIQNNKGLSDAFDPPRLCYIGELLEIAGWMDHPIVGPLIARWRDHFGFGPDYLDRKIVNAATLIRMREVQEEFRATVLAYTPADFDRTVPGMWERFRSGLPYTESEGENAGTDVISIVNAGWTFAQLHLSDLYRALDCVTAEDRYRVRTGLNELVARAVRP